MKKSKKIKSRQKNQIPYTLLECMLTPILILTFAKFFRAFPKKVRAFAIFCKSQNQNRAQNTSVEKQDLICLIRIVGMT